MPRYVVVLEVRREISVGAEVDLADAVRAEAEDAGYYRVKILEVTEAGPKTRED